MLLSASAIVVGYISVIIAPSPYYEASWLNQWNYYYTYFGLILMAIGFASLILLSKRHSSTIESATTPMGIGKRKKAILVFLIIFILSILIGGFHLKLQRENEFLQQEYQQLREGFPFLVNDEWTNNEGVDSNIVNYKGAIFNSGRDKIYNVTLLLTVNGPDNTSLKRTEYFIGEINGWHYQAFDVNIEYYGEMSDLNSGYSWDNPNSIHG